MSNEMISGNPASDSNTVNEQAMYSAIMYLPLDELTENLPPNPTLDAILGEANNYANNPNIDAEDRATAASYVETITAMAGELKIDPANVTMNNPSWSDPTASYGNPRGFLGATFTNGDTTTIALRSTPDGAWPDNGYFMNALAV